MVKKLSLTFIPLVIVVLLLCACGRQQENTGMVTNKEKYADFTMQSQDQNKPSAPAPMLPGKARVPGAPFQDFQTQTGEAVVLPSQLQTIEGPTVPQ